VSQTGSSFTYVSVSPDPARDGEECDDEQAAAPGAVQRGEATREDLPVPKCDTDLNSTVPQRIATPTTTFSRRKGPEERAREAQKVQDAELNMNNENGGKDDRKDENQTSQGREDDEPERRGRLGRGTDEKQTATATMSLSKRKAPEVRAREVPEAAEGKSSQEVQTDPRRQSSMVLLSLEEEFQRVTNGRQEEKAKFTMPFDEESVRREFEKLESASSASSSTISTPQLTPRNRSARNGAVAATVDAAASKKKQEGAAIMRHRIDAAAAAGEQAAAAVLAAAAATHLSGQEQVADKETDGNDCAGMQPVEQNSASPRETEPTLEGVMRIIPLHVLMDFMHP
jgi:hypothetical protein